MIRMLFLFIQNPFLASQVRELLHRCHLHLPDVWIDLPSMTFSNRTFSVDPRTTRLLHRAISNLTGVHTLRLIFGHQTIVQGLLSGFLNRRQTSHQLIRRLWIESSCFVDLSWINGLSNAYNLKTFRCRRLSLFAETYSDNALPTHNFGLARSRNLNSSGSRIGIENGTYTTTVRLDTAKPDLLHESQIDAMRLEDSIYRKFPRAIHAYCNESYLPEVPATELSTSESSTDEPELTRRHPVDINQPPNAYILSLLNASASTLTSFNLDWLLGGQTLVMGLPADRPYFPNLRALQVRNAVEEYAKLPYHDSCCLFSKPWLDFIKRHPKIQCLAWPLERLIPSREIEKFREESDHEAINHLCHTLKELRLDTWIDTSAELGADRQNESSMRTRLHRRAFIDTLAPKLTALESFKLEGSVNYSDRNEIMRALHQCPLRKVVIIGSCWPVHDSWADLSPDDRWRLGHSVWDIRDPIPWQTLNTISSEQPNGFQPQHTHTSRTYEEASPFEHLQNHNVSNMLLETLALTQASTITELKFCGFKSAPPLSYPAPETHRQLSFLAHFHNLTYLTTAIWLSTYFQGNFVNSEVRASWYARHRGIPTALTLMDPVEPRDRTDYARYMIPHIEPSVLADRVAQLVGPHLSSQAIERKAGVTVKALFLLHGQESYEVYEMEVRIGRNRHAVSFVGPSGEHDPWREQQKMLNRGWF